MPSNISSTASVANTPSITGSPRSSIPRPTVRSKRMNRTIKEATVKRFHYDDHDQLHRHLADFVLAYNFGRRLKTLKGLTPYEHICRCWTNEPERFTQSYP